MGNWKFQRYYINNNSILLFDKQWKPSSCASQCSEGVRQLHILREDRDDELLQQAVNQSAVQPSVLEHFKYSSHAKLCGVSTNDSAEVICKGSVECEQVYVVCVWCVVCVYCVLCVYVCICSHVWQNFHACDCLCDAGVRHQSSQPVRWEENGLSLEQ